MFAKGFSSDGMDKIDHKQYAAKRQLLKAHGVSRAVLYRWVIDLATVRLVVKGRITLEEVNKLGINFDDTLKNVKLRDEETY